MNDFKNSKTAANLLHAFGGEAKARDRYDYFASVARKEGYIQIANIFELTANNEKEHGEIWFKALEFLSDTKENLTRAIAEEHEEWTEMYKNFAEVAQSEGYEDIARLFERVGSIEKNHEARFTALLANLENGEVFARKQPQKWICIHCGFVHNGDKAPNICPACKHPQAYFEIEAFNY